MESLSTQWPTVDLAPGNTVLGVDVSGGADLQSENAQKRRTRPLAWVLLAIIAVGAVVALVAGLGGHGGGSVGHAGTTGSLGTAIPFTLTNGGTLSATVEKIVAPATPAQYEPSPASGNEYVGVKQTIVNTGSTNAAVDQGPITALVDSSGQSFSWTAITLSDCPALRTAGTATVAPGSSVTGCIAYEVPQGDTLSEVTVGSSGNTPGIWRVS
jgi:hypothetical protein